MYLPIYVPMAGGESIIVTHGLRTASMYLLSKLQNYLQHKTVSKFMQPEKLEDWKKSSIHPLLLQFQLHDIRQKKVRYMTSEISATSVVAKKHKKN